MLELKVAELLTECLESRGFDSVIPVAPVRDSDFSLRHRYGALPNGDPDRWGYRDPAGAARERSVEAAQPRLTKAELEALVGDAPIIDDPGTLPTALDCSSSVRVAVFGSHSGLAGVRGYEDLVKVQSDSADRLYSSIDGQSIVNEWSQCMATQGFEFKNWWDPPASFEVQALSMDRITAEERFVASADAKCRRETKMESRLLEVESPIQEQLLSDKALLVAEFMEQKRRIVERLEEL